MCHLFLDDIGIYYSNLGSQDCLHHSESHLLKCTVNRSINLNCNKQMPEINLLHFQEEANTKTK